MPIHIGGGVITLHLQVNHQFSGSPIANQEPFLLQAPREAARAVPLTHLRRRHLRFHLQHSFHAVLFKRLLTEMIQTHFRLVLR
jgi:hypothetical protein